MGVMTRHIVSALLLWSFEDNWQVRCESSNSEEFFSSKPSASVERYDPDGSLSRTIRYAPITVNAVPPSYKDRLASPGAVATSNFKAPTSVYVAVPLVSFLVGFCSIYAYCSWKKNMLKNRGAKLEKVAESRRRVSLMPGAGATEAINTALKYGLYARSHKSEHDPAALITFSAAITGLATELEMVDNMVLEYKSPHSGEAIPEFHKLDVENDAYSVSINPLFNALQSGACGYVLSSAKNPLLRFTDGRRTSVPLRLENSAYTASSPGSPRPPGSPETENEDDETDDETETDGQEGVTSDSERTSTAIGSTSSPGEGSTSETDTSEKGKTPKRVVIASSSKTAR